MIKAYGEQDYKKLANAVLFGFPIEEAQKCLKEQRQYNPQSYELESTFWLELKGEGENIYTSIQLTKSTKARLNEMKINKKETYESVILRLINV